MVTGEEQVERMENFGPHRCEIQGAACSYSGPIQSPYQLVLHFKVILSDRIIYADGPYREKINEYYPNFDCEKYKTYAMNKYANINTCYIDPEEGEHIVSFDLIDMKASASMIITLIISAIGCIIICIFNCSFLISSLIYKDDDNTSKLPTQSNTEKIEHKDIEMKSIAFEKS